MKRLKTLINNIKFLMIHDLSKYEHPKFNISGILLNHRLNKQLK
jgi:hypothetical protein